MHNPNSQKDTLKHETSIIHFLSCSNSSHVPISNCPNSQCKQQNWQQNIWTKCFSACIKFLYSRHNSSGSVLYSIVTKSSILKPNTILLWAHNIWNMGRDYFSNSNVPTEALQSRITNQSQHDFQDNSVSACLSHFKVSSHWNNSLTQNHWFSRHNYIT